MRNLSIALICLVAAVSRAHCQTVIQEFTISEHLGVKHIEQLIDFDLNQKANAGKVHVIGPDGVPVLFQLLEGGMKLAVLADLPAGKSRTWKLMAGAPSKVLPALVTVTESTIGKLPVYSITNKVTGIKVPYGVKAPMPDYQVPWFKLFDDRGARELWFPAPIQDVMMRDKQWASPSVKPGLSVKASKHVKSEAKLLERGPLRAVVEVTHHFESAAYWSGDKQVRPAGQGFYKCTIRLEAGRSSVLVEEETDLNTAWYLDLYRAVKPDQFRYWGHRCGDARFGQEEDGSTYQGRMRGLDYDAILPVKFDRQRLQAAITNEDCFRTVSAWDPWRDTGGFYWQMFNTKGTGKANVVGIFAAKASRAIGVGPSGPAFWIDPPRKGISKTPTAPLCGIGSLSQRVDPGQRIFPKSRFAWGLFVATREDVKPVKELQAINQEMNIVGGINLNALHRFTIDFPEPKTGFGALFMAKPSMDAIKKRVKEDRAYYNHFYTTDVQSRNLFDLWAEPGREKFDQQVAETVRVAKDLVEDLVNGRGVFSHVSHYWHGGSRMANQLIMLDQLLGDSRCTAEQRIKLKTVAVLFAAILHNDDFVPLIKESGVSLGSDNMYLQYVSARRSYGLFLSQHPAFADRAKQSMLDAPQAIGELMDKNGVVGQSPHYALASVAPTLSYLAMVQQRGQDPLHGRGEPSKFGEFFLNLLTPPEPRFAKSGLYAGARAPVILGDGGFEPSVIYGLHGTLLRDADPKMSARLIGAWHQSKKPHTTFNGSTAVMIDDSLNAEDPRLGDYDGPGYYTVHRHGWGTPNESALWLLTGDRFSDHRHLDHGSIVLYALGKPIIANWSSFYAPHVGGSFMHNGVMLEKHLTQPWDKDGVNLLGDSTMWSSSPLAYGSFEESAFSQTQSLTMYSEKTSGPGAKPKARPVRWTRTVVAIRVDAKRPVFVIRDECDATELQRITTFNVQARGEILGPAGPVAIDEGRLYADPGTEAKHLPFTRPALSLKSGVNRFFFTGQHDVDCDVFTLATDAEATLGNWGVRVYGGIPTGLGAEEAVMRQHILRVRSAGTLTTVLAPYRRTEKRTPLVASREGDTTILRSEATNLRITSDGYVLEVAGKTLSRTFALGKK